MRKYWGRSVPTVPTRPGQMACSWRSLRSLDRDSRLGFDIVGIPQHFEHFDAEERNAGQWYQKSPLPEIKRRDVEDVVQRRDIERGQLHRERRPESHEELRVREDVHPEERNGDAPVVESSKEVRD